MTELSITALTCADCHQSLEKRPRGGKPRYCPPCGQEQLRISNRDAARRRKSGAVLQPERYACADCPDLIVWEHKGRRPERCKTCRASHQRAYLKQWQRAKGHLQTGETLTCVCKPCGAAFEWEVIVGRRPWKCDRCRAESYVESKRASAAALKAKKPDPDLGRVCVDCDQPFTQRNIRGPIIVRCPDCTKARAARFAREYGRHMTEALVAARRVTYEVEGRHSECLGCGKVVQNQQTGKLREWCDSCLPARRNQVLASWKMANPDAWRDIVQRANRARRVRLNGVESEPYNRMDIFIRDKWTCQLCKKKINKRYTGRQSLAPSIDHQIPLALGGADKPSNVVTAHFGCNSAKRARYLPQGEQLQLI
ncbi:HNH endonuclease [Micromonosporaceae bacterium Da 78-11]